MDAHINRETNELVCEPTFERHLGRRLLNSLQENKDSFNQIEIISGKHETHGSVRLRSIRVAEAMKSRDINVGDMVCLCAVNHNDTILPIIASMFIGVTVTTLAISLDAIEFEYIAKKIKPKLAFVDPDFAHLVKGVIKDLALNTEIVVFDRDLGEGFTPFSEFLKPFNGEENFECKDFDPDATIATVLCSSGTTGQPKLIARTHTNNIINTIIPILYLNDENLKTTAIFLNFSAMDWVTGINAFLSTCLFGGTHVHCREPFSSELTKYAIETYKPEITFLSSVSIHALNKYKDLDKIDFSSIKLIGCGGNVVDEGAIKNITRFLPNGEIAVGYGSTEVGAIVFCRGYYKGSIGKPNPWIKWRVVDLDTNEVVGPNTHGELRVLSQCMFKEYIDEPVKNLECYDEAGFFKTGDIVYYDEEGYFYIIDRINEMIKYGPHFISTTEIEMLLNTLPGVLYSCVVGVPHETHGHQARAFLQLVPDSKLTVDEIYTFVRAHLSEPKQLPGGIFILDKLPLTHTKKIDRKVLKKYPVNT